MDKQYIKGLVEARENGEVFSLVASTGTIDRQGETVNPEGWILTNFKDNPSILWQHNASLPPIGKATRVAVEGGSLVADIVFAEKESDFAAEIARLVRGGFLNSLSVGFQPTEVDDEGNSVSQELLEISVVNIPANPDARFSRAMKSFEAQKKEDEQEKPKEKSPACRQEGESKDECVSRKIPELVSEDGMGQDQAVAVANNLCDSLCSDEDDKDKTIAELEAKIARLELALTKPTKSVEEPKRKAIRRPSKALRALRHADKAIEVALRELKGGEKK